MKHALEISTGSRSDTEKFWLYVMLAGALVIAGRGRLGAPETLEGSLLLLLIPLLSQQGWD